jgi:hypothetical protein
MYARPLFVVVGISRSVLARFRAPWRRFPKDLRIGFRLASLGPIGYTLAE